jgi:hypothetical protein
VAKIMISEEGCLRKENEISALPLKLAESQALTQGKKNVLAH